MLADRVNRIEQSPTLKISAKAKAMKAAGIDVIDLSVGEPDFPTPDNIKEAAEKALHENFTHYTQNDGIPELKNAIILKMKRDSGVSYEPNEILVSCGAKHSLSNLFVALLNKEDEVIIPAPYWVSYPQQVLLAKGKPVIVTTREEDGFRLTPKAFKDSLTFKTKAIIINNPSNPTGSAYPRSELEEIAKIAVAEGILIIADEIYEKIIYDDYRFTSIASLGDEVKKNTVIINGVSKAYSMTGWRIGFAAGPHELIAGMDKIQSHGTSNPNSIAQKASIEAFKGQQSTVDQMLAEFRKRRNFMLQKMSRIKDISCYQPQGAFYLFPNISSTFNKEFKNMTIRNSFGLAYYLLKEAHVAVVPGEAFGTNNYIRLSYSTSLDVLEEGMERIIDAFSKLKLSRSFRKIKLNNVKTTVKGRIPVTTDLSSEDRDALIREAEYYLPHDNYYEWNANINGIIIQLRTNVSHVNDFWIENWYPAPVESDIEPHGIIYAIDGVPGREASSFFHSDSNTGIIFNSNYYGQTRLIALGIVAQLGEKLFNFHTIRAGCLDNHGRGTLLLSAGGGKKDRFFYGLLSDQNINLHSEDVVVLRYRDKEVFADITERKYYVRTKIAHDFPNLENVIERNKCENVVSRKEDCQNKNCDLEECALEKGEPFCLFAFNKSRVMIDPAWLVGHDRYQKRTSIDSVVVFYEDAYAPKLQKLSDEQILNFLQYGDIQAVKGGIDFDANSNNIPYLNPYLLTLPAHRKEIQNSFFNHLAHIANWFLINTADDYNSVLTRLKSVIEGNY